MMSEKLISLCEQIARQAHSGQARRDGSPYISHPMRVALSLETPLQKCVGWLHDTLEDTHLVASDLTTFGVPDAVVGAVVLLTRRVGVPYETYLMEIAESPLATSVKIADMVDNLTDDPTHRQVEKYQRGLAVLAMGATQ